MTRFSALLLLAAVACAPRKESADSTSLAAIDTLKPAPVSTDTTSRQDSVTGAVSKTKGTTPSSKTKTTKRDSIIGYDKAIQFDPTKRRLDTVKKRPPR